MKRPQISVIVPVYNAEKYLRRCVDSVLAQTFKDFELLLVDDGSTDASSSICDEYANADSRVYVFHKSNEGVSAARNLGIENARGEWIIFVDSDDYWIERDSLQTLFQLSEINNLDIVRGEYISIDSAEEQIEVKDYSRKLIWENKLLDGTLFVRDVICGEFFLVLCLFRKDIIADIRFDTNMIFLEDAKFFMRLLSKPLKCGYTSKLFYAYRKIQTSASHKPSIKKLSDSFGMCDFYWDLAEVAGDDEFSEYCKKYSVMMYYWTLQSLATPVYFKNRKLIIKQLELIDLQRRIKWRLSKTNIKSIYKPFIWFQPSVGVVLLFIKDRIIEWIK